MTAIFNAWEKGFEKNDIYAATATVTHDQLEGEAGEQFESLIFENSISGIPTIVNEADALSITELMALKTGGDNDGLARHLAVRMTAARLVLVTSEGGVFENQGSGIMPLVTNKDYDDCLQQVRRREVLGYSASGPGRGGMSSKLEAAWQASRGGVAEVFITSPEGLRSGLNALATHYQTTEVYA
jgi:glutamate 5-kinase